MSLQSLLLGGAGEVLGKVGSGISNILDRAFPKKMSQREAAELYLAKIDRDIDRNRISAEGIADARKMFMVEMRTQKQPWIVRFLLGMYRPIAGYLALWVGFYRYLRVWFPFLPEVVLPQIEFIAVMGIVTTIVVFFFGSAHKGGMSSPERRPGE